MNLAIFTFLNDFAGRFIWLDSVIVFCAVYLGWIMAASLIYYFYQRRHRLSLLADIFTVSLSGFLAWTVASLIKYNFVDPRPFLYSADTKILFTTGGFDSFPSAHTAFFSALAIAVFWQDKKWGSAYLLAALAIALSRVAAGVHWPVDILAGLVIAVTINIIVIVLFGAKHRLNKTCG